MGLWQFSLKGVGMTDNVKRLNDGAVLKVLELLTQRVGERLEKDRTAHASPVESVQEINAEFDAWVNSFESQNNYTIVDHYIAMAVSSVIAVASMVAGAEVSQEETVPEQPKPSEEVITKSGLFIVSDLSSLQH
jgi:hypothetical protein